MICSAALALALVAPHWDPRAERFLLVGLSGTFANANNWLVYERDDYMDFFSNDVHDYNPFLHLWSLGVEEQFLGQEVAVSKEVKLTWKRGFTEVLLGCAMVALREPAFTGKRPG